MTDKNSTQSALQVQSTASIVPTEGGNLELSAQSPDEIVQCHEAMVRWCENKLRIIHGQADELKTAYLHAKKCKWKYDTLERQWKLTEKRVAFYGKMLAALKAGYHIIPIVPVELFAIRTDRKNPTSHYQLLRWSGNANFEQSARILPEGEGQYKNPQPVVLEGPAQKVQEGTGCVEKRPCWAESWDDLEFPAHMARLHIMEATSRAMALKVFDDLGMLPADYKRNPDPMIIGRIFDPRPNGYAAHKAVYFLIAWHIDTSSL